VQGGASFLKITRWSLGFYQIAPSTDFINWLHVYTSLHAIIKTLQVIKEIASI
jgi:hypothetical protein